LGKQVRDIRYLIRLNGMAYHGDVYDSPPGWLRVLLGAACLAGGVFMLVYLIGLAMVVPSIITVAAIGLALFLIGTVPSASNVATVSALFLIFLGAMVIYLEM